MTSKYSHSMYDDSTNTVFIYLFPCFVQNVGEGEDCKIEEGALHIPEDIFVEMVDDLIIIQRQILEEKIYKQEERIKELEDKVATYRDVMDKERSHEES